MGIFSTDYTEDFKRIRKDIEKINKNGTNNTDAVLKAIDTLTKRQDELTVALNDIKVLLLNMRVDLDDIVKVPSIEEEEEVEEEVKSFRPQPGDHISTYSHFEHYKIPRYYDLDSAKFYSIGGNGAKKEINLSFRELVAIIKGHLNGLSVNELRINPILQDKTAQNIRNYTYIWRAGGFNNAINKVARELGFNPDKLISRECESVWIWI